MKTLLIIIVLSLFSTTIFAQEKPQQVDIAALKILDAVKEGTNSVMMLVKNMRR
jgi:hypothetical protein